MTERSEYTTSEADYIAETLEKEKGLAAGTPEFEAALAEFRARMDKYGKDRLYPKLGNRPVLCFYSMSKRRARAAELVSHEPRRAQGTHGRACAHRPAVGGENPAAHHGFDRAGRHRVVRDALRPRHAST